MINPVLSGSNLGIMSEAGMPCIADPGNLVVAEAHKNNIQVVPLVGPNSSIMAYSIFGATRNYQKAKF